MVVIVVEKEVEVEVEKEVKVKEVEKEVKEVKYDEFTVIKCKEKECKGCMKMFPTELYLKKHHDKSAACVKWIALPDKDNTIPTKGLHLIIDELLKNAISLDGKLECKYCNSKFTNNGNLHKHLNTSIACNRLVYNTFKIEFNSLGI